METGFILNNLCILGVALREQFPKNLWRSAKAGNRDLFLTSKFPSLIFTPEHEQMALVPYEEASIPRRVI
jgi:hypothetical protein